MLRNVIESLLFCTVHLNCKSNSYTPNSYTPHSYPTHSYKHGTTGTRLRTRSSTYPEFRFKSIRRQAQIKIIWAELIQLLLFLFYQQISIVFRRPIHFLFPVLLELYMYNQILLVKNHQVGQSQADQFRQKFLK